MTTPDMTTGMLWSSTLPDWQRDYYSLLLLETLRTKSILVPYCQVKRDYSGANSGTVVYSEVFDTEPDWTPLAESDIWLRGAHLDSRTVKIDLEIHGDVLKFSDYSQIVQYIKAGNMRGLVKEKIGQNQVDYLDILARNAFASLPSKTFAGGAANRVGLQSDDYFTVDIVDTIRVHLEENDVPGVTPVTDQDIQTMVCTTTPRVIKDIRTAAGTKWVETQLYSGAQRLFNGEVGMWGGVRFIRSNRLRLRNAGVVEHQTTLTADAPAGSGAAALVDSVYTPGQTGSKRYIEVADATGLDIGRSITITDVAKGTTVLEADGSQETRRIVGINGLHIELNKPLLKPHNNTDYVTLARDVHLSVFHGGPSVVYGIGEDPHVITPPQYDDLMMINRYGWRGFLKFQTFRPEFCEVVESAGSTD